MATNVTINATYSGHARRQTRVPARMDAYGTTRVAAGLKAAAADVGVQLHQSYAERVAADGLARCQQLGVKRVGRGVVIHTAPEAHLELPIVLGYADASGEWLRDGNRHDASEVSS